MIIPVIEPLLITGYNGEWVHPLIELLTLDFDEDENGNLSGDIIRLDVEFRCGKTFRTIVLTNEEGMVNMMIDEHIQDYLEMLFVSLGEDVWRPGEEQFVFTRYGMDFNNEYPIFTDGYRAKISPDISLKQDGDDWWWNS